MLPSQNEKRLYADLHPVFTGILYKRETSLTKFRIEIWKTSMSIFKNFNQECSQFFKEDDLEQNQYRIFFCLPSCYKTKACKLKA